MPELKDLVDLARVTKKVRQWDIDKTLNMVSEVFTEVTPEELFIIEKVLIEDEIKAQCLTKQRILELACESYSCRYPPKCTQITCVELSSAVSVDALYEVTRDLLTL